MHGVRADEKGTSHSFMSQFITQTFLDHLLYMLDTVPGLGYRNDNYRNRPCSHGALTFHKIREFNDI